MKRTIVLIPLIPILLLALLNACTPPGGTEIPIYVWTFAAQIEIASSWTPTPTTIPTATPDVPTVLNVLNMASADVFDQRMDQLEDTISVAYEVYNVEFLPLNAQTTVLQVDVRCQCGKR